MLSDTARALGPELAVNSSGQALATWDSETGPDCAQSPASLTCIHTVEVAWRDGFGQTWDWPVALARPGVGATPRLALNDAGRAAVIWVHDIGRDRVVQATYRTGPVDAFPNPSDLSAAVLEVRNHHVGLDAAGNAVAVWAERHADMFDVAAEIRSVASGTWGAPVELSTGDVQAGPSLAATPGGQAFAVWIQGTALLAARADLAKGVWDPPVTLSHDAGSDAAVAVNAGGDAVAIWTAHDRPGIEAAFRPSSGSWGAVAQIVDGTRRPSPGGPDVALAPDGTAVAVWIAANGVLQATAGTRGASWAHPAGLGANDSGDAHVAIDPHGNAIMVWRDKVDLVAALRPAVAGAWQPAQKLYGGKLSGVRVGIDAAGNGVALWNVASDNRLPVLTSDFRADWQPTLANARRPSVRGRAQVGRVVLCNPGVWTGTIPIRYAYTWLLNGRPQRGGGRRYHIRRGAAGALLACRVAATNVARTLTATSVSARIKR